MAPPLIMVVEDNPDTFQLLDMLLTLAGYHTAHCPRAQDAHGMIKEAKPDLIILDMWLGDPTAGELVLGLLEADPGTQHIPVIICSGHVAMLRDRLPLFRQKGYVVLEKPYDPDDLLAQIAAALQRGRTPEADAE